MTETGANKRLAAAVKATTAPIPAQIPRPPVVWGVPNPLSALTFYYVTPLVQSGYHSRLEKEDLKYAEDQKIDSVVRNFEKFWAAEQARPGGVRPNGRSLIAAITNGNSVVLLVSGVLVLVSALAQFAGPVLLYRIIDGISCIAYSKDEESKDYRGCNPPSKMTLYSYAGMLLGAALLYMLCFSHATLMLEKLGLRMRNALMAAVYRKCLRLNNGARNAISTGKIVTLMSNDCQTIERFITQVHGLWSNPAIVMVTLALLYNVIQWSSFVGLGSVVLVVPVMGTISVKLALLRKKQLEFTDVRVNIMSEIINGIRVIKFYAWEASFLDRIMQIRAEEVKIITTLAWVTACFVLVLFGLPVLVAVFAIGSYALAGNDLNTPTAFTALALFNQLRFPLAFLPFLLTSVLSFLVGMKRVQDFLCAEEVKEGGNVVQLTDEPRGTVRIIGGEFCWDVDEGPSLQALKDQPEEASPEEASPEEVKMQKGPTLSDIKLTLKPGSLNLVVGPVGSGKSSLLATLTDDINVTAGTVGMAGTVAYVAQSAFILNDTLQNNVLFSLPMDRKRYQQALKVCQLESDLAILPNGDQTLIGERGVTLSGGQKQRVSLARAVYADADVYLLDDSLSAVDAHVGAALVEQCFCGFLKNKTRVLVTNALQHLPIADHVIVMDQGRIVEQGGYAQLMAAGLDFASLVSTHTMTDDVDDELGTAPAQGGLIVRASDGSRKSMEGNGRKSMDGRKSIDRKSSDGRKSTDADKADKAEPEGGDFREEERAIGMVDLSVWITYAIAAGGKLLVLAIFLLWSFEMGVKAFNESWLGWWADDQFKKPMNFYLGIWVALSGFHALTIFFRGASAMLSLRTAAKNLHEGMLNNVLRLPMSFFDVTPSGRVINRFSKDTEVVDNNLPGIFIQFLGCMFTIFSTLVVISVATHWFAIAIVPIVVVYAMIQRYYIPTSRELQRLESITRSPIYAHFSETLNGIVTVRAFRLGGHFTRTSDVMMEVNAAAYLTQKLAQMWLNMRLEFIGMTIIGFTAFLSIEGNTPPTLAALALVYSLEVTRYLKHGTDQASQAEAKMNAVERLIEYTEEPTEAAAVTAMEVAKTLPAQWPTSGALQVHGLCIRYRPELPLVLDHVSFDVAAGAKVGIVGRTGSGKSSLLLALYRLMEAEAGCVRIDGVDVRTLGLTQVRQSMAMIPQDPFMFAGTVRMNIDPFSQYSDQALWDALESVGLKDTVAGDEGKLEMKIVENGNNFSLGQRQLFCMARAILQNARLLMMDEATASVDMETDESLQQMVKTQFRECTVLTIAHRLNTIMESDDVLVLAAGKVAEYDHPSLLLDAGGMFADLVGQTGKKNSEFLKSKAAKHSETYHANRVPRSKTFKE